ncbi:Ubiquitin carboxyl-terminal hydrolase 42, partial [Nestor notabilis]
IQNSSRLNGNGPLKEDTNTVGIAIKRPSSAPPTACIQNWAITRPSATDPSKAQKITISIHNKLPERQTVSQPDCLSSAVENEDLSKAVPSSTITNSFTAESTSNASTVAVAINISKQEVPDEMFVEPAVNGSATLGSDTTVPYSAESSGKSEASNGVFKMNCNISSNGIVIGKVVGTLQNSHSFCESAEEERSHHELPKNDSLNGAISLDTGSKQNGLKLDDFACQVQPAKPSEIFFAKTNGLLEPIPVAESPIPQEIILESLAYSHLNRLSEKTSVPAPQKSEGDRLMETVVTETVFVYEESRTPLSDFGCEVESPFTASDSETIATKEVAESIITKADNAHPSINGQHKVRKKSLDTEDEYLGQCESEDSRDKDKPRRPKEPALISKEDPSYIKGSPESEEKLGQTASMKSDIECSPKKLASLDIIDKCQDTKDISNNYVEVPPVNDSSITKLDKVLESQFSRQNEGLNNKKCEEDNRQKHEEKIHDSKKNDKEHYRKKRRYSDFEEKEKQTRSKTDDHTYKRRRSRSMETNKQYRHKQDYCSEGKYRPSHNERNSPNNSKSSGKYSRYRSRSRERTEQDRNRYYHSKGERTWSRERYYQDESRRWEKCRYYKDYYSVHGTGDGRERKSSHFDKDFDKLGEFYKSHRDYLCKSRWSHNTHSREEGVHHFNSHRANFRHCSVPQQQSEKHSRERHAPPPASAQAKFDSSSRENEKHRLGKRKYSDTEGSESEMEKKCHKIEDQRMKKDKKVKKKKKSKDKYREKDYKLHDLDGLVFRIDNDNRKRKKKKKKKKHIRKLKDFSE